MHGRWLELDRMRTSALSAAASTSRLQMAKAAVSGVGAVSRATARCVRRLSATLASQVEKALAASPARIRRTACREKARAGA